MTGYQIQFRRDTAANWTSVNPIPHAGEPCLEIDTGKIKIGDGSTTWNSLGYLLAGDIGGTASDPQVTGITGRPVDSGAAYQALMASHSVKLQGWNAALAARKAKRVNIVFITDSVGAGQGATSFENSYPQLVAAGLNARFPTPGLTTHGRGFLPPIIPPSNPTSFTPDYVTVSGAGAGSFGSTGLFGYGPNLETWDVSANGGTVLTYDLVGDSADILSATSTGNGSYEYSVDGGAFTTVSTDAAFSVTQVTHVSLGSAGPHTLVIQNQSGGPTYVTGVVEYNGDYSSGIQVHGCGFSGSTSTYWTSTGGGSDEWAFALPTLSPDLVIIELGLNDPASSIAATTTAANVTHMIATVRGALTAPQPPFVVSAAYNAASDGPITASAWQAYVDALYGVSAADSQVEFLDWSARMPSTAASVTWDLYAGDGIHPLDRGHQMIADMLVDFLSPR